MGLVDYSDSDSEIEQPTPAVKAPQPSSRSKPAFAKVVDRSNPGKVKVSLPQIASQADTGGNEPPAKRAKISGGGAFGGFNSFLPAPKRPAQTTSTTLGGGGQSQKSEPNARFSFKTGAAPAFDRGESESKGGYGAAQDASADAEESEFKEPMEEVKLVGKPLMFRPLSVSRKPVKKKVASAAANVQLPTPNPVTPQLAQNAPRPKVSLFSMSTESDSFSSTATSSTPNEYRPMMYEGTQETDDNQNEESQEFQASYEDFTPSASQNVLPAVPTPPVSQSLDDIAGDLNLSAADRRQLFGRQRGGRGGQGQSAMKVINFNMDKEYLHNEELRAAGEQVALNPVRAIAPGKHSLKQLVNAAVQQKDALEESFAKGKSNRQEASSRYGW